MSNLTDKFIRLKTSVGGNREKNGFEYSFGMTREEMNRITLPSRANRRILAELEYALHVNEANDDAYTDELDKALSYLLEAVRREGVITNSDCARAEEILSPMAETAKSYKLYLTGHAHIDMNWMWSYQETVAATLATFTTMCNIMDEYPEYTFSQSQASVYRIVEQYDPELMARIKKHIDEGRWEVVATSWVESDKNMPSGESLLRHVEYTRNYLKSVWGVKDFDIDFVPDTFGHAITIPEIDSFCGVKYMYHCRGNSRDELLYKYRAPSGRDIMVLREANWYNAAITPQIASGLMEVVKRSSGLKTGMVLYGVGDHGGGPTRRDVERTLDMMTWPIYPTIKFGTLRDYFREAEAVRDRLPVVTEELNFFAPGCYTTQSRIKAGNRRTEAALYDTEALAVLAEKLTNYRLPKAQLEDTWRDVLFTHFHDILTGSCVQDSREYAMALYQTAAAFTNTQREKAMRALSQAIDTYSMPALKNVTASETADYVKFDSQSEGAGAGYGVERFTGVPSPERSSGLVRVFNVFNTLTRPRTMTVDLTVWDYPGDLKRVYLTDTDGNELEAQLVDTTLQRYWDHHYFRILVRVQVPALGYTTLVLRQRAAQTYNVYLQNGDHVSRTYDDIVLDNGLVRAVIDSASGRVKSFTDEKSGSELIPVGSGAGLEYLETERRTSSAWNIGRTLRSFALDKCTELTRTDCGSVRNGAKAVYSYEGTHKVPSVFEVVYSLDAGSASLRVDIKTDWQEQGADIIPVLSWKMPVIGPNTRFCYLVPSGYIGRPLINNDVPGIGCGAALLGNGSMAAIVSDSKYGYRSLSDGLALTLINSSVSPDPYPERGIHNTTLWMNAACRNDAELFALTQTLTHPLSYCSANVHTGTLPPTFGLIEQLDDQNAVTAVRPSASGVEIRGYSASSGETHASFRVCAKSARTSDLSSAAPAADAVIDNGTLSVPAKARGIWAVNVEI